MADDAQLLADAKKLPLGDQLASSNWKVRAQALATVQERVGRAFSCEDEVFAEAGPLLAKAVGDSNANVMDKAVEALVAYLEKADEGLAARIAGPAAAVLASKCLKGKPATVAKTGEACMLLIELEQQAVVIEAVLKAFGDKVPKVVLAAVDIVAQAVSSFGAKAVDPKPIMKALPSLFGHTQAGVRDKAKEVSVELCAYLGQGVVAGVLLDKMPAAMRKDVDAAIGELPPGKKQPSRWTRREAAERATCDAEAQPMDVDGGEAGEGTGAAAATVEEEPEGDAYEFATPVDILGPLGKAQLTCDDDPPVPFWDALENKKWGLRKAALDKVKELGSTPRLSPGDYGELCRVLRKILQKDSIVPVAAAAADVCTVLACGLRDNFTSQAKMMVPPLLERFKEKNIVMSKSSEESLRTLAQHCVTLADVAEDVAAALDHKNPKVKRETAKLVRDVLEQTPKAVVTKLRDSILPACAKLAEAGDSEVREAAQAALVAFAVRAGSMGILDKVMDKLDDSRKKKIEEMVQEAIAAAKGGAGGRPAAAAAPAAGRPPSRQASNVSTASGSRPGTARSSPKALAPKSLNRPAAAAGAAAKGAAVRRTTSGGPASARGGARAGGSSSAAAPEEDLSVGKMSNEELEERMVETFGGSTVELLRSAKWQERVEAMGSVLAAVQALGDPGPRCYELVQCVAFLPGWSDKNFQVLNKEFEVLTHLARTASAFGRRDAAVALGGLVDKIHELKHKVQVCEALTALSEAVGPQFVMAELHKRAAANKNPKVLAEALGWIAEAVPEFGLGACDVKAIIEWMKADLGSPNAPVRTKAMEVLGKCHAQLGPSLVDFLEGLKPAQLMALEEHFRQNPLTQVVPTRKVRSKKKGGAAAAAAGAGGGAAAAVAAAGEEHEEEEEGGGLNPDDLLPRTDISGGITPALLSMISSSNWKERNAGVDQVIQLLAEAAGRIQPNVGELFPALKGRMTDSNRNLAAKVLQLLGDIARAMGPPFDKGARPVLFPAVANLSDNKKQVRDGVLYMLDAWIDVSSAATLFPAVAEATANPKCIADGKVAGLQWLTKVVAEGKGKKGADAALRAAAVGMADKAVGVRDAGAALLNELLGQLGQEAVVAAAGLLVSADKKLAMEALTKVLGGPVSASSAAAPAAAAAAASSRPGTAASNRGAPSRAGAASRPGTARPATAAPAAAASAAAAAAPEAGGPILAYSESKAERARKYRPRPGKFEGVAPEEAESLQRELAAVASPDWYGLLFAKDFKRHLDAAEQLMASLSELLEEVQASLDLILRWAVLRICDGNMQSLVKVLEMCKVLLEGLAGAGYQLTDYEALCLLPAVVEKAGHNQDRVRALHRDVLRLACSLYAPHKVVDFLVQGLGSKSNRTKIECCEEIGCIIEREGMAPVLQARSKPMPAVAALLKERDGATRAAALRAIEQAWAEEGDGVWKLLGRLEGREQDMVQEKLKRSTKQPRAVPETAAAVAQAAAAQGPRIRPGAFVPREPVQVPSPAGSSPMAASPYGRPAHSGSSGSEAEGGVFGVQRQYSDAASAPAAAQQYQQYQRQAFTPPNALATPLPARPGSAFVPMGRPAAAVAPTPVPGMRPYTAPEAGGAAVVMDDAEFDARWTDSMQGISSPSVEDAVEHMKMLCGDIMLALQGAASPHMLAVMGQSADALFDTVNQQLQRIFADAERQAATGGGAPPSRGAKYALNIMLQGMNVPSVSMGITQRTLRDSISLLLLRLLEEHGLLHFEEGATLVKAVNVLMLKILECSNRTYAFAALLQLLRDPPRDVRQSTQPGALTKFHDLVVKCLIKLTKGLQASQEGVDLGALLFNLHDFFLFLGVDEIRKRSSSDDKPLRMVKTILHELCKMLGYSIYQYTAGIPGRDADPQPIIFAYISLNLQTLSQSGLIAPPAGAETMSAPAAAPAAQAGAAAQEQAVQQMVQQAMSDQQKAELKGRLKDVMSRLMQRDQSAAAMQELHVLRKEYPAFVERYIATTSDMFRQFIDTGLAQLAAAEAAGGAPAARSSSSGESSGSAGGQAAAQQQQQHVEPVARRPSPVPPLALQRPPLSPPVTSPSGTGGSLTTPGGTTYSPSNPRLAAIRERLGAARHSSEGGLDAGAAGAGAAGGSQPTSGRSTDDATFNRMSNSLESLQQRLASLQQRRNSNQG
ncbi:microtubule associated isoform A [Chlorella sorokiniana]|uniref:Microtubule associated isoform A n=1 Tax=Chlorella sorokiniana TaxID=3076 RepID=A0A2P6TD14_CHLSO|nr:microtubule associated isoform A [Chlorella sorokiniana]|eukprot:PRW20522.1 microtubule associated isoform A [Chlorella sorokiniana]